MDTTAINIKKIGYDEVSDPTVTPYVELCLVDISPLNRLAKNRSIAGNKNETVKMKVTEGGLTFKLTTGKTEIKLGPNAARTQTLPITMWVETLAKYQQRRYEIRSIEDPGVKTVTEQAEYKEIPNLSVRGIIQKLMDAGNEAMRQAISIKIDNMTDEQLQTGQRILVYMTEKKDELSVKDFNDLLLEFWKTIPRPMNRINQLMAHVASDFDEVLDREQKLMDMLYQNLRKNDVIVPDKDIMEAHGIEMSPVTDDELKEIKELMTSERGRLIRAWRVENKETRAAFEARKTQRGFKGNEGTTLLFHGSGIENWFSIITNGLKLNPELIKSGVRICGKAFGYGIYFAPYCKKSMSYANASRSYSANETEHYMGVYEVLTGNPYYIYQDPQHKRPNTWTDFHKDHPDMDCCWASAGYDGSDIGLMRLALDETIVYQENQCTIKYLLEFM